MKNWVLWEPVTGEAPTSNCNGLVEGLWPGNRKLLAANAGSPRTGILIKVSLRLVEPFSWTPD